MIGILSLRCILGVVVDFTPQAFLNDMIYMYIFKSKNKIVTVSCMSRTDGHHINYGNMKRLDVENNLFCFKLSVIEFSVPHENHALEDSCPRISVGSLTFFSLQSPTNARKSS